MGIFADVAGDFRQLAPLNEGFGSPETNAKAQKAHISGVLSGLAVNWTKGRSGWLLWEGSNQDIPKCNSGFEISREFRLKAAFPTLETFGPFNNEVGASETPS